MDSDDWGSDYGKGNYGEYRGDANSGVGKEKDGHGSDEETREKSRKA